NPRGRFIQRLKRGRAPGAVIDAAAHREDRWHEPLAVQPADPRDVTDGVVLLGPLALEHRLGLAVVELLLPVRLDGVAAVMPDDSRGREPQLPTRVLDPPAEIDIIARNTELRIAAADRFERRAEERHVAAGDVLS